MQKGAGNITKQMMTPQNTNGTWLNLPPSTHFTHFHWARKVLLVLALTLSAASLVPFHNQPEAGSAVGWQLHLISLAVFVAAFVPGQRPALKLSQWALPAVLLAVVVGVGLALRLHQLSSFPDGVWLDEADNANHALRIVRDSLYRPVYVDWTNLPAHFLYVMAYFFSRYGGDALAMRYTSVFFGVLTITVTFLLFRRWFGLSMGFVAAGLLATMRWHLTFSRVAMHGVTVPLFVVLVLYLLDRVLEYKRALDAALLGLALGLSLCFYTPLRFLPVIVVLALVGLLGGAWRKHKQVSGVVVKQVAWLGAICLMGAIIAALPLAQYTVEHPDQVFLRTGYVSIWNEDLRQEKSLPKALLTQTLQHLLMFNGTGDSNGRHNIPDAPMLDLISGILFAAGLMYAVLRAKQPANALMLLVFIGMSLPGILSRDSPHALRTLGMLPAALYFMCLPIHLIYCAARQRWQSRGPLVSACLMLGLAVIGIINFQWFFEVQKNDPRVRQSFAATETQIAREVNRLLPENDIVLTEAFYFQPTAEFLINDLSRVTTWKGDKPLDVTGVRKPERGLAVIVEMKFADTLQQVAATYPGSQQRVITSIVDGTPIALEWVLPK